VLLNEEKEDIGRLWDLLVVYMVCFEVRLEIKLVE
jgi:hypothetical protein